MSELAKITIRGRKDPLYIDRGRAQKLKDLKFGYNNTEKADPSDDVDLGEWSGEMRRIIEIEMPKNEPERNTTLDHQRREEEEMRRWLAQTPEQKGQGTGYFELAYSMRIGNFQAKAPKELIEKAIKKQVDYFRKNPKATRMSADDYGDLLPPKRESSVSSPTQALANKFRMDREPEQGEEVDVCECGKALVGKSKKCGACVLAENNGKLSTE